MAVSPNGAVFLIPTWQPGDASTFVAKLSEKLQSPAKRAPVSAKISGVAGVVAPFLTAALLVQVAESPHVSTP